MAKKQNSRKDFYVYALYRPNGGPVCYIGKGQKQRLKWSARGFGAHNSCLLELIKNSGGQLPGAILVKGLTEKQALKIEIGLIAAIGRSPHGTLVNLTNGGEGGPGAGSAHWNGKSHPEVALAIGNALRGKPKSKDTRAAMSISAKNRDRSAGYSVEHAAAIRAGVTKFWERRRQEYNGTPPALGKEEHRKVDEAMRARLLLSSK